MNKIDRAELIGIIESGEAALLNVLPPREYEEEHIPDSINIPLKELTAEAVSGLTKDQPVVVYCHDGL